MTANKLTSSTHRPPCAAKALPFGNSDGEGVRRSQNQLIAIFAVSARRKDCSFARAKRETEGFHHRASQRACAGDRTPPITWHRPTIWYFRRLDRAAVRNALQSRPVAHRNAALRAQSHPALSKHLCIYQHRLRKRWPKKKIFIENIHYKLARGWLRKEARES